MSELERMRKILEDYGLLGLTDEQRLEVIEGMKPTRLEELTLKLTSAGDQLLMALRDQP